MNTRPNSLAVFLYITLGLGAILISIYKPIYNWDLLGYVASAKRFETKDPTELHDFAYHKVKNAIPDSDYKKLAPGPDGNILSNATSLYRYTVETDSEAFSEQLPYYRIRVAFTGLIYLLHKAGVDIVGASHLISGIAVALSVAVLFLLATRFLESSWVITLLPVSIGLGILVPARLATPDGLAMLAIMLCVYFIFLRRFALLLVLLPLVITIRSDFILMVVPLLSMLFILASTDRWKLILSGLGCVLVYIGLMHYFDNAGWSTVFYFVFVEPITHPLSQPPLLTAEHYFTALFSALSYMIFDTAALFYMTIVTLSGILIAKSRPGSSLVAKMDSPPAIILIMLFAYVVMHFLIFPRAFLRFFTAPYVVSMFCFFVLLSEQFRGLVARPAADSLSNHRRVG